MGKLIIVSHPEVVIDPGTEITDWGLSEIGRRRATAFAQSDVVAATRAIWSSTEAKAVETADILAAALDLSFTTEAALGENDRSATGFLPRDQFELAADAFFANPKISYQGWETAVAAQARIRRSVGSIVGAHDHGDLVIVTHGAVGTLLWCHYAGAPIDRKFDQPGQGHYWIADLETLKPECGWRALK
ncbi:broad specificity phosphatase PhoE [Litoreibacter ponti]|uniref:Broad specificity phosphatase PhoE n=1 Tax=Litoreibacter ponti TaxID=1510457 RepID=A0A2T6BEN1_9RHOB|nr:histidine phosphatase family protein [Litoreibacter ponti]PTX54519.1 broad specificity phosphatase PhoE [Litoreibacter ponti]